MTVHNVARYLYEDDLSSNYSGATSVAELAEVEAGTTTFSSARRLPPVQFL